MDVPYPWLNITHKRKSLSKIYSHRQNGLLSIPKYITSLFFAFCGGQLWHEPLALTGLYSHPEGLCENQLSRHETSPRIDLNNTVSPQVLCWPGKDAESQTCEQAMQRSWVWQGENQREQENQSSASEWMTVEGQFMFVFSPEQSCCKNMNDHYHILLLSSSVGE